MNQLAANLGGRPEIRGLCVGVALVRVTLPWDLHEGTMIFFRKPPFEALGTEPLWMVTANLNMDVVV